MKIDQADKVFSQYIRTRADWRCEYCGTDYTDNTVGLHNSHYWSRGKESTRFDPDNCMALCYYHHLKLGHGDERDEYKRIMIEKLGEKRFKQLDYRAHQTKRKDRAMSLLEAKELLKSLE